MTSERNILLQSSFCRTRHNWVERSGTVLKMAKDAIEEKIELPKERGGCKIGKMAKSVGKDHRSQKRENILSGKEDS
jgi:hypothetical protein